MDLDVSNLKHKKHVRCLVIHSLHLAAKWNLNQPNAVRIALNFVGKITSMGIKKFASCKPRWQNQAQTNWQKLTLWRVGLADAARSVGNERTLMLGTIFIRSSSFLDIWTWRIRDYFLLWLRWLSAVCFFKMLAYLLVLLLLLFITICMRPRKRFNPMAFSNLFSPNFFYSFSFPN